MRQPSKSKWKINQIRKFKLTTSNFNEWPTQQTEIIINTKILKITKNHIKSQIRGEPDQYRLHSHHHLRHHLNLEGAKYK